ncbi:unnamed protein product [Lymnaea stagnalis]|uniref:Secreted protein n=1 Tax=Lymnaea stagnalis TaxID=6523 RepID=A0AAV2I8R3_LYMST
MATTQTWKNLNVMATLTRQITLTLLLTCVYQDLALTQTTDEPSHDFIEELKTISYNCFEQILTCSNGNTSTLFKLDEKRRCEKIRNEAGSGCLKNQQKCTDSEIERMERAACDAKRLHLGFLTIAICVLVLLLGQMQNVQPLIST